MVAAEKLGSVDDHRIDRATADLVVAECLSGGKPA